MAIIENKEYRSKSGGTLLVRSAEIADAAALLAITGPVLAEMDYMTILPEEFKFSLKEEEEFIQKLSADPSCLILIAELSGNMVGLLHVDIPPRKRMAHCATMHMLVKKEHRGMGAGTALIAALLDWAKAHPAVEKISLMVFADNRRAIRLYEKMGFAEEGRLIKQIKLAPDKYVDALLMYRLA